MANSSPAIGRVPSGPRDPRTATRSRARAGLLLAGAVVVPMLGLCADAGAGTTLLDRQSYIQASVNPSAVPGGAGGYDASNRADDFGRFADAVRCTPDGSPATG